MARCDEGGRVRLQFQRKTFHRGWLALLVSMAVMLAPMVHAVHLVVVPHLYCAEHGHFESHDEHQDDEGRPPVDRGEHDDEDTVCLLVLAARGGEQALVLPAPALESTLREGVQFPASGSPVQASAISYAPKQSPPVFFFSV
jgi:hypothetical protein